MSAFTKSDLMTIVIARYLTDVKSCFHGLASTVPMVGIILTRKLYNPELLYLNITGGVNIQDAGLTVSTDGGNLLRSSKSSFNLTDIFDYAARGRLEVAFLSGGQVDRKAQINNTVIGTFAHPKVKLPGGAGSAVLIPNCKRAFIWKTKHDKRSFVEQVDFVTSKGNVDYVFTPLCVFKNIDGLLMLDGIMPDSSIDEIMENTGFQIIVNSDRMIDPPTESELSALSSLDPTRCRDAEF